jgi:hypothetical protein
MLKGNDERCGVGLQGNRSGTSLLHLSHIGLLCSYSFAEAIEKSGDSLPSAITTERGEPPHNARVQSKRVTCDW